MDSDKEWKEYLLSAQLYNDDGDDNDDDNNELVCDGSL